MWLTKVYPELSFLSSNAERRVVVKMARAHVPGGDWLRVGIAIVGTWLGVFLVYHLLLLVRIPLPVAAVTSLVVFALIGLFSAHLFWNKPMHVEIRRLLNERGFTVCISCGCNLTGLPEPRCPECGQPFNLSRDAP